MFDKNGFFGQFNTGKFLFIIVCLHVVINIKVLSEQELPGDDNEAADNVRGLSDKLCVYVWGALRGTLTELSGQHLQQLLRQVCVMWAFSHVAIATAHNKHSNVHGMQQPF